MRIQFQIHYKTHPGQQLAVVGSLPALGSEELEKAPRMDLEQVSSGLWILNLEDSTIPDFSYRYAVRDENYNTWLEEWGPDRTFRAADYKGNWVNIVSAWRSISDPRFALHSSAFEKAILRPEMHFPAPTVGKSKKSEEVWIRFNPRVIRIKPGHRVAVAGSAGSLGKWMADQSIQLGNPDHPTWTGTVYIPVSDFPIQYKYLIRDEEGATLFWEQCSNRILNLPEKDIPEAIELNDEQFDFPHYPWKGSGLAIPVFSLRRKNGFGVGEFTDLHLLVDWAVETGNKLLQILPINDTVATHTWKDSYPYAAISVYALHPIYINLQVMGRLGSETDQKKFEKEGKKLQELQFIDYEGVMKMKSRFFKLLYDQNRDSFLQDPEFHLFFNQNEHWLRPYAAFSYLRDRFKNPDFTQWEKYSTVTPDKLAELTDPKASQYDDIAVHYFIQFHAYRQLQNATGYARDHGVVLKGDIPIGIYRNSVDAWLHPNLFHMDRQAGAPPDDFSTIGQNWRFPTYNWDEMAKDQYAWWRQRLQHLAKFFDAFRIDHILGFFRIWEIPMEQEEGLMGYFNPSIPYTKEEMLNLGIWFDEQRLCRPYIREHFLRERFGEQTEFVKQNILLELEPGSFSIRPEYDTQNKLAEKLAVESITDPAERSQAEQIIRGMNSLVSEVLFLTAPDGDGKAFFPRNALHFTRSYQELDGHQKKLIDQIYLDYFYRRNEEFWRNNAMLKLPAIKRATNMLLCGEDLGMVPACVPIVMNELGILSLEVQRMPKNPKITFGHPANYPYLSVATPSSHDTSTLRGWWEENPSVTQTFFNQMLGRQGVAPFYCSPEIAHQIILQHLYSPSMWAIFPVQDILGMDEKLKFPNPHEERINNPGNPNHYWRYRMHLSLEDLLEQTQFNRMLKEMIRDAGRLDMY